MPGVAEGIYAQYYGSVITMAKRTGGVSRPEIMKGLSVTRPAADRLIDECRLKRSRTEGRTDFFSPTKATDKVLGSPESDDNGKDTPPMLSQHSPGDQALLSALVSDEPAAPEGSQPVVPKAPAQINRLPVPGNTAPAGKTAATLDGEIVALKKAISEAEEKAKNGHMTYVVQTAHACALGTKLQRALEARLSL